MHEGHSSGGFSACMVYPHLLHFHSDIGKLLSCFSSFPGPVRQNHSALLLPHTLYLQDHLADAVHFFNPLEDRTLGKDVHGEGTTDGILLRIEPIVQSVFYLNAQNGYYPFQSP